MKRKRRLMINVRVTGEEVRMFKSVAEYWGMSVADIIRQYVRKESSRIAGEKEVGQ